MFRNEMTIGELRSCVLHAPKQHQQQRQKQGPQKCRNVVWKRSQRYRRIYKGATQLIQDGDIARLYNEKRLTLDHISIYVNLKDDGVRHPALPLYEAVFEMVDGRLIIVQKRHLKQMYRHRTDNTKAYTMNDDAEKTPYWVDRYLFSVMNRGAIHRK